MRVVDGSERRSRGRRVYCFEESWVPDFEIW